MNSIPILLIVAGGTGGHIFPGLVIAKHMQKHGWNLVWLGSKDGIEAKLIPNYNIPIEFISFKSFRDKNLLKKLMFPLHLLNALYNSFFILRKIRPNVVLCMGGYITFPIGLMTFLIGLPLVLHEQNSIAGLTNRILAKFANRVLVGFPNTLPNAIWTGNPIRKSLLLLPNPTIRYTSRIGSPLQILVVGGSLGAVSLNKKIPYALAKLREFKNFVVLHQAGTKNINMLKNHYLQAGFQENDKSISLVPFITNITEAYSKSDIIICRAGAMTVAEITAVGIAALFIPFPFAVNDHQTHNALFLANNNAADILQQNELSVEKIVEWFIKHNRTIFANMANRARLLGKFNATEQITNILCEFKSTILNKNL